MEKTNQAQILEFPFNMNWIANIDGGQSMLTLYWTTLKLLNKSALGQHELDDSEIEALVDVNDLCLRWDLRPFRVDL